MSPSGLELRVLPQFNKQSDGVQFLARTVRNKPRSIKGICGIWSYLSGTVDSRSKHWALNSNKVKAIGHWHHPCRQKIWLWSFTFSSFKLPFTLPWSQVCNMAGTERRLSHVVETVPDALFTLHDFARQIVGDHFQQSLSNQKSCSVKYTTTRFNMRRKTVHKPVQNDRISQRRWLMNYGFYQNTGTLQLTDIDWHLTPTAHCENK